MAEASPFIPVSIEYEVLQEYFDKLTQAIGDTGISIAISCFSSKIISEHSMDQATLGGTATLIKNYHLLKAILSAVVSSPENLIKFLSILEMFPPLDSNAKEIKAKFDSLKANEVASMLHEQPQIKSEPIKIVDQDVFEKYYEMRDKLGELVYEVQKAVQSANVDIDDLRGFLILKNILNDAVVSKLEEAKSLLAIFQVVCRDLCSPINLTVLRDIANNYKLHDHLIIAIINIYEIDQELFHLKLSSAKFAEMLVKEVELTGRDPKATETTIEVKLSQAYKPLTVSEFKEILDEVFQEFARYIHVLGAKDGCVCVTLYAPKAVMGALVAMGKRHIPYLIDAGVISLIIGGKTIINNITDKEEEEVLILFEFIVLIFLIIVWSEFR
jgi:hypothetical protein